MPAPNQAKGIAGEIKSEKLLEDDSDLNVGASLLAKAVYQKLICDTPHSRASSLPQGISGDSKIS
jgi:hypothetical protein